MTTHNEPNQQKKSLITMTEMLRSIDMHLLHEALARARMLEPHQEASHGSESRRVAMRARARQARELGDSSETAVR